MFTLNTYPYGFVQNCYKIYINVDFYNFGRSGILLGDLEDIRIFVCGLSVGTSSVGTLANPGVSLFRETPRWDPGTAEKYCDVSSIFRKPPKTSS